MAVIYSNIFNFISLLCFLVINLLSITAANEDFNLSVREFGASGTDYVKFNLTHGLQPGSLVSVVSRTYNRGVIDIIDNKWNNLIHIHIRIKGKSKFYMNSYINKKWLPGGVEIKNPVVKGALTVTTIAYEPEGYRILVNNTDVAFFNHRSSNPAWALMAFKNTIYKIVYYTGKEFKGGLSKYLHDVADLLI